MDSQLKYEIILRAPLGEMYNDVLHLCFVRTPLLKQSSYAILRITLSPILIQQMVNDLTNNIYQDFSIEIYSIDESSDNKPFKTLFNKLFKVLFVKSLEPLKFDKQTCQCYIVLANPFIHYMSTTNTYNTILEGMTGYEAIKEFENFIKDTHSDIFTFNHIATKSEVNDYKYEQLLIKAPNDLSVPLYIINTFKPFNSFNFYFFDDFYLSDNSDKEIACHYLNLFDINQIQTFDISQWADINSSTKKLSQFPISDQSLNLDKMNQTFTVTNREIKYNTLKSTKSEIIKHSQAANIISEKLVEDRIVKVGEFIDPIQKNNFSQSSQHANIYSPDEPERALYRFDFLKEYYMKKLDIIQVYETTNSLPDWCQFGKRYNMDAEDSGGYLYTPINIINMFIRANIKENYCTHLVRYSMLKFVDDEDIDFSYWSSSKYRKQL